MTPAKRLVKTKAKTKSPVKAKAKAKAKAKRPTRRSSMREAAPMQWPEQLNVISHVTRDVFRRSGPDEACAIAEFLLDVGLMVMNNTSHQQLLIIAQDAPLDRLLRAIAAHARHSRQMINDVVTALIHKLGPDAVEEERLN